MLPTTEPHTASTTDTVLSTELLTYARSPRASTTTCRADTPALARESHKELRRAVLTSRSRESVYQNPARQIAAQLALDAGWRHARLDRIGLPQPRA